MNSKLKKIAKWGISAAKSNQTTRRFLKSVKKKIIDRIDFERSQQEIYNVANFYPTIQEYVSQQHADLKNSPLISILLPTYNTPIQYLRECIDSILIQSYGNWELCIADDNSPDRKVVEVIKEYQHKDKRIKLVERKKNGHISESTNSALRIASGEFVALMDHDDVLWPNALYEMVKVINKSPDVDLIYTDEDKIDGGGAVHSYPFLKPDFSPEFLESCNYITHFSCIRRTLMEDIGGFRKGCEGAQDWDLFIRIGLVTTRIIHIPKILYSWRVHEASTASDTDAKPYVYEAQLKLLQNYLKQSGRKGEIEKGIIQQHRTIKYFVDDSLSLEVIIRVKNQESLEELLQSIKSSPANAAYKLTYVCDDEAAIDTLHSKLLSDVKYRILPEFSWSDIEAIQSPYVLYIESTNRIISDDWARLFLADVSRPGVGFVGPAIMNESGEVFVSSGVGVGYGAGLQDMLVGQPMEDPHYTRGLYAKSRRNVSAVNETCFAVKATVLKEFAATDIYEIMINSLHTYRHIYTPYIRVAGRSELPVRSFDDILIPHGYEDKYLNPNFKHENGNMEVRYK
jgi:glycosyltransferase involved in cell wall biosynthesis